MLTLVLLFYFLRPTVAGSAALVKYGYEVVDVLIDTRPLTDGQLTNKQCDYNKCCKSVYIDRCDDHYGFKIKDLYKSFILRENSIIECSRKYFLTQCDNKETSYYDNKGYTKTYTLRKGSANDSIVLEMKHHHGPQDSCDACIANGKIIIDEKDRKKCTIFQDWYLIMDHHHLPQCPRTPQVPTMSPVKGPVPTKSPIGGVEPRPPTDSPTERQITTEPTDEPAAVPTIICSISNDFPCTPTDEVFIQP